MTRKNGFSVIFVFLSFLYGCAGLQNTSYVVQTYKIDGAPFSDIKKAYIYFQGMDSTKFKDAFAPSDTGKGFFTRDSLNKICFEEFNRQIQKRLPKVSFLKAPTTIPANISGYLLLIERMALAWTEENNFMVGPQGVPIALFKMRVTVVDLSMRLPLFTLVANAEVIVRAYSEPWHHGARLSVTRIIDYIESEGEKHETQPAG